MSDVRKPDARETALEVLMQVDSANAWSDGGLKRTIAKNKLDSRDAALATRLCYGVIQNRMLLDYYIGCWCSQRPERLESVIRNILRLGGYQILFLDKVPPRAAVNEAVEMTKRHRREKAAGMVNAILRKFAANREDMPPLPKGSPAQTLSLRYSHPRWLVERLLSLIGEEETEAYLRMNNQVVPTTIQTNPLKGTPEELEKLLRQTGAQVEPHPWLAGCFSVSGTGDLEQLSAFREGRFTVQDAAARLVATVAAPAQEDRVLDVCAAPGGKSFAMAMDRRDRGQILSCDVHPHKLKLIDSGAQRLGITSIRTALADAREEHAAWLEQADVVVADVPCSGLGIIRKKPDIRIKTPVIWPSFRPFRGIFWKMPAAMCVPVACWCTPPARCCRRKIRRSSTCFSPATRSSDGRPSPCRGPWACVTGRRPCGPSGWGPTAFTSAECGGKHD